MADIHVTQVDPTSYDVTVRDHSETKHTVMVSESVYQSLTGGAVEPEELVEASFRFLLERESNTMILSRFDLPLIGQYFPEFEQEIRKRLAAT